MVSKNDLVLSAGDILSHPRFPEARKVYIEGMLGFREYRLLTNQPLFDQGRVFVFFTIIMMHARFRPEDRTTWPTIEALKRLLEDIGVASARRVHEIVQRLIDIGFLESLPLEADRRVKVLTPTEAMLALDRQSLTVYFHPLQVMFPAPGYPEPMRGDREFQRRARRIGPAFMSLFQQVITANATIGFFLPRQGGIMILTKLMHLCHSRGPDAAPEISFVDIGESFGTSRTHVRKLLREAEAAGLVRLKAKAVEITSTCQAGFDRFLADTMTGQDLLYRFAQGSVSI